MRLLWTHELIVMIIRLESEFLSDLFVNISHNGAVIAIVQVPVES